MKKLEHWFEFTSEAQWTEALARSLVDRLQGLLAQQPKVVLAVSGGQSPRNLFHLLSQTPLDWSRVVIQLVDERLLSRNHPDSNATMVESCLIQNQAAAANWVNLLPALSTSLLSPQVLNAQQRAEVLQAALMQYTIPDVVILGMGEDGHTASLFPDAAQLAEGLSAKAPDWLMIEPAYAPYERISMSLPAILRVPHIYLAAWGHRKRLVLAQAVQQPDDALPISHILHFAQGAQLHVYCSI